MASLSGRLAGIDVGATLCKIAVDGGGERFTVLPSAGLAAVRAHVTAAAPARIVATGGGAGALGEHLAGVAVEVVAEFEALARGVRRLAGEAALALPERALVVSIGTGTSIVRLDDGPVVRVGGTAVGGGTMLGLAQRLLGTARFAEVVALAAAGDRRRVDLLVGEVYAGDSAPAVIRDLTASNFAKLEANGREDLAHAIVGLVGETVALLAGALARAEDARAVVYCGTTLADNEPLAVIVRAITRHFGHEAILLPHGGFAGAIGCLVTAGA
jgi:type II pantothenate kinase